VFQRLIADLRARTPLERGNSEVGALLASSHGDWQPDCGLTSRPGAYTRNCAYRDDQFEVLILNWAAGAASPIHDHGGQRCWMMVLDGSLEVDDYVRLDPGDVPGYAYVEPRGSRLLEPGDMDLRTERFDLHRVKCGNGSNAVSLHVYAAPLRNFFVYDETAWRCNVAFGTYDAMLSNRERFSSPV